MEGIWRCGGFVAMKTCSAVALCSSPLHRGDGKAAWTGRLHVMTLDGTWHRTALAFVTIYQRTCRRCCQHITTGIKGGDAGGDGARGELVSRKRQPYFYGVDQAA